jgi:hypothetical protein
MIILSIILSLGPRCRIAHNRVAFHDGLCSRLVAWYLSTLHRFNELVDKIVTLCGAWVVEVEACRPRLRGCPTPTYPSPKGSPRWVYFSICWPADEPLDELGLIFFP